MENAVRVLSKKERLTLQRLLKKLGKQAAKSSAVSEKAKAKQVEVKIS